MNEYRNNNFNDNNNNNFENSYTQQNGYNQYQAQAGSVNEFTYNPNKKKSKGKKVLSGIIAVLCVAAIGTTSIVGYRKERCRFFKQRHRCFKGRQLIKQCKKHC